MLRKRNMTPWPLATPEQAQYYTIEKTRTNAGQALLDPQALARTATPHNTILAMITEVETMLPRVEVRIEQVRVDPYGEATGIVWTRVDGGEWINEGGYLLSRKFGAPRTLAEMPPPDYEPLPSDFDPEENYEL